MPSEILIIDDNSDIRFLISDLLKDDGYEIRTALEIGKKVICLFRIKKGQRLSAMISGSRKIINLNYNNIKSLKKDLDVYISKIKHLS